MAGEAKDLSKTLTIEDACKSIAKFEDDRGLATDSDLAKWKSYTHQVLVESDSFFYKIYEVKKGDNLSFDAMVRKHLAVVYQEMGIDWELISFERDGYIYDFEKRQKLEVVKKFSVPFEDVLLSFSYALDKVEAMLGFPQILEQLQELEPFKRVKHIKIARTCVNKYQDYAHFDGGFVCLDDADFYIAFCDENCEELDISEVDEVNIKIREANLILKKNIASRNSSISNYEVEEELRMAQRRWCLVEPPNPATTTELAVQGSTLVMTNKVSHLVSDVNISAKAEYVGSGDEFGEAASGLYRTRWDEQNDDDEAARLWKKMMKLRERERPTEAKTTDIVLTESFCENYLEGKFNIKDFSERFNTSVAFEVSSHSKPTRDLFRRFLLMFAKDEPDSFELMMNLKGKEDGGYSANQKCRVQDKKKRHSMQFAGYSDCDNCMLCDIEQVRLASF